MKKDNRRLCRRRVAKTKLNITAISEYFKYQNHCVHVEPYALILKKSKTTTSNQHAQTEEIFSFAGMFLSKCFQMQECKHFKLNWRRNKKKIKSKKIK